LVSFAFLRDRPPQQTRNEAMNCASRAARTNQKAFPSLAAPESTSLILCLAVIQSTQSMMKTIKVIKKAKKEVKVATRSTKMLPDRAKMRAIKVKAAAMGWRIIALERPRIRALANLVSSFKLRKDKSRS